MDSGVHRNVSGIRRDKSSNNTHVILRILRIMYVFRGNYAFEWICLYFRGTFSGPNHGPPPYFLVIVGICLCKPPLWNSDSAMNSISFLCSNAGPPTSNPVTRPPVTQPRTTAPTTTAPTPPRTLPRISCNGEFDASVESFDGNVYFFQGKDYFFSRNQLCETSPSSC